MKVNAFIFSILIILEVKTEVNARLIVISKQCNEVYSTVSRQLVPYEETYETRNWIGARKYKTRVNYKYQTVITNHTRAACCRGFAEHGSYQCSPICSKNCGENGYCAYPEQCVCEHGYAMHYDVDQCKPICMDECINGYCAAPNTCKCKHGYAMLNGVCSPICDSCNDNEICEEPHVCHCRDGYSRVPHSRLDSEKTEECHPVCNRACVNGVCVQPNVCRCNDGYGEFDGDEFTCEPRCSQICVHGDCTAPDVCTCHDGFRLQQNSTHVCEPFCPKGCINAACTAPGKCSCLDGYLATDEHHVCEPYCSSSCTPGRCIAPEKCDCDVLGYQPGYNGSWCEPVCTERCVKGVCEAPDTCKCLEGFKLQNGSLSNCIPSCTDDCKNGQCIAPETCVCDFGYQLQSDSTCAPVCSRGCVMGKCVAFDTCECNDGYNFANGSIFECIPSCTDDCTHGTCTAPNECTCDDGYEMTNSTDGSSKCIVICECENGHCSDTNSTCQSCLDGYDFSFEDNSTICKPHCTGDCAFGQCVGPQKCECDEYYVADNDTLGYPICVHACGGECVHGSCSLDTGLCSCLYGWAGKHCDEPSVCSITPVDQSNCLQFNGPSGYKENENATEIEEPWTGPICNNLCTEMINNTTACTNQSNGEEFVFLCFLDINSPCNSHSLVQANTSTGRVNYTILTCCIVILLLAITGITIGMFIRKRRLEKSAKIKQSQEDNLIESENDGISL